MKTHGIDAKGLFRHDREYVRFLADRNQASLESISRFLGLDVAYVKTQIEDKLVRSRFVELGSGGRRLTELGRDYLEKEAVNRQAKKEDTADP
jgi:Holliday junction resolvasome RuvABC ATP-dependent DNA helicase subunit